MNDNKNIIRTPSFLTINLCDLLPAHNVFVSISPREGAGFSPISPLTISTSPAPISVNSTPQGLSLFPEVASTFTVRSTPESSSSEATIDSFSDEGTFDSYPIGMDIASDDECEIDYTPMDIDEIPMDIGTQPAVSRKIKTVGNIGGKRPNKYPRGRSLLSR